MSPPGKLDEFGLIARLFAPLADGYPGALGLTDDCCLLDGPPGMQWAVTADAMVAGVHFLPDDPPDLIARKLIRVNLSDLAAMGARPFAVMLALCLPKGVDSAWVDRFAAGLKADCAEFGIGLVGGDTVATPGPLTLSLTAFGQVAAGTALLRSNARSGDEIWVSGTIGDAALGLEVAQGRAAGLEAAPAAELLGRYRLPRPRMALGPALVGLAHAAMDISDGLVGDLQHICDTSGVGAVVEAARVPLSAAAEAALAGGVGQGIASVLTGGDDYELLFTAPPEARQALLDLGAALDLRLSAIGRIIAGRAVSVVGEGGRLLDLAAGGYRHFRG